MKLPNGGAQCSMQKHTIHFKPSWWKQNNSSNWNNRNSNQNTSEYVKVSKLKRVFEEFQKESQVIEVNDGTEGTQSTTEQLGTSGTIPRKRNVKQFSALVKKIIVVLTALSNRSQCKIA